MAISFTLKTGSLAALAAALMLASLPASAMAQEHGGGRHWRSEARSESGWQNQDRGNRAERANRSEAQSQQGWAVQRRAPEQQQSSPQPRWQGRGHVEARGAEAQGTAPQSPQGWNGSRRTRAWSGTATATPDSDTRSGENRWSGRERRDGARNGYRNTHDGNRNVETWRRPESSDRWGHDNNRRDDRWREDNRRRDTYRDADRRGWRDRDHRNWNREWRRDTRYDWYSWRNANRSHYRMGRYYAPYRNYYYRRLSIGFYLDNLFFSSRYWISDPWSYRLPDAYGPYRWVRYYDDALLVNIHTGEVIDVIHDFFW